MTRKTMKHFVQYAAAAAVAVVGLTAPAQVQAQEPMLGELRNFGFNFCPRGWAAADGQILPINQNQSLYSLLGTTYGGDGRTSFALPDLRGRVAVGQGEGAGLGVYAMGQKGGAETVVLSTSEMPSHNHAAVATRSAANKKGAQDKYLAFAQDINGNPVGIYNNGPANNQLNSGMIANAGGNQAHENRMPYQVSEWCIALQGLFPSRP